MAYNDGHDEITFWSRFSLARWESRAVRAGGRDASYHACLNPGRRGVPEAAAACGSAVVSQQDHPVPPARLGGPNGRSSIIDNDRNDTPLSLRQQRTPSRPHPARLGGESQCGGATGEEGRAGTATDGQASRSGEKASTFPLGATAGLGATAFLGEAQSPAASSYAPASLSAKAATSSGSDTIIIRSSIRKVANC